MANIARFREDLFKPFLEKLKSRIFLNLKILGSMTHSVMVMDGRVVHGRVSD